MNNSLSRYLCEGILAGRKQSIDAGILTAMKDQAIEWYRNHGNEYDFYGAVQIEDGWIVRGGYKEEYVSDETILSDYRKYGIRLNYELKKKEDLNIPDFISRNWIKKSWLFKTSFDIRVPREWLSDSTWVTIEIDNKDVNMTWSKYKDFLIYYHSIGRLAFTTYNNGHIIITDDVMDFRNLPLVGYGVTMGKGFELHADQIILPSKKLQLSLGASIHTKELVTGEDNLTIENNSVIDKLVVNDSTGKVEIKDSAIGNINTIIEDYPKCKFIIKPNVYKLSSKAFGIEVDSTPKDALGNPLKVGDEVMYAAANVSSYGSKSGIHIDTDKIKSVGAKVKVGSRMQNPSDMVSLCGQKFAPRYCVELSKEEVIGQVVVYVASEGALKSGMNIKFGRVVNIKYRACDLDNGDHYSLGCCSLIDPQLLKKLDKTHKYNHLY